MTSLREPADCKIQALGIAEERVEVEPGRGPQQELVHLAELPLGSCRIGALGGLFYMRVQWRDREATKNRITPG